MQARTAEHCTTRYPVPSHAEGRAIEGTANTSATSRRDPVVDGLKFVAAGAIVMVHVAMRREPVGVAMFTEQVSYSALYFFFLVSGYFHGPLGTRGPSWLKQRFVRLGVPYLVWSLVFVGWWNIYHLAKGWGPYIPDPVRFLFFAGGAEVLWSLPWLFACAVLAEGFARSPKMRGGLLVVAAAVQLGVWFLLPAWAMPNWSIRQYIDGGRWVFMYVLGMQLREAHALPGSPRTWGLIALVASLVAGAIAWQLTAQPKAPIAQLAVFCLNGAVAAALLAGAKVGGKWLGAGRLAWGGDYLLGVYVSHLIWLDILVFFVDPYSMPVVLWLVLGWAVAFGMAVLVTRLLLASRWTRLAVT